MSNNAMATNDTFPVSIATYVVIMTSSYEPLILLV